MKKKPYVIQMGCKPAEKVTPKVCFERSKFIAEQIAKGRYSGKMLERARYYIQRYRYLGRHYKELHAKKSA